MDNSFQKDTILINHLIKGNEKAYTFLVSTFSKRLFIYALSLCNDHNKAQDIVQEVFLKIWKARNKLNTNISIKNYLYKCVYNEFINIYHRNKKIMSLEKSHFEALNESLEESNSNSVEKKMAVVLDAIENLPPRCKQTFLLSKKEGLTNIEISKYLKVSISTVETQMTKAFSILRNKAGKKIEQILILIFNPIY